MFPSSAFIEYEVSVRQRAVREDAARRRRVHHAVAAQRHRRRRDPGPD